jgi:catechol 2,3-dioxygenase-like lactoylglutathione lyase family enzyme
VVYSDDATATRAFFRDVLRWPFVSEGAHGDAGVGGAGTGGDDPAEWLIFRTGPSELGVHPTSELYEGREWRAPRHHSIAIMCDDLDATVASSRDAGRGARRRGGGDGVRDAESCSASPGADDMLLYEPRHATAYDLS